jgi:nucleotide-binding universal stress UspA family protein
VDLLHDPKRLQKYPLAFLPGSAVIERAALRALDAFVKRGGKLVVTGPIPTRDERGRPLRFLDRHRFTWIPDWIAQEKPEEEKLENLALVAKLLTKHAAKPHVRIRPEAEVLWVDWQATGGHREWRQPRNLGSAILHTDGKESILFALNHYIEAVRFVVEFGHLRPQRLVNLDTGETLPVRNGRVLLDLDRKSASIFRME